MRLTRSPKAPTAYGGQAAVSAPHVTVLSDRCAGCQECAVRCPQGALALDVSRRVVVADDALCVGCRQCERTCPFSAITVDGPPAVSSPVPPASARPAVLAGQPR